MKKLLPPTLMLLLAVACVCFAQTAPDDEITIQIAPHTLVLKSPGIWVTVHADILYSTVDRTSVCLDNGFSYIPAFSTKRDDCGNLVAKFLIDDIKAIVSPPKQTLKLTGLTKDGAAFFGEDTMTVK